MNNLVGAMLIFTAVAIFFFFIHMVMGKMLRPARHDAEKVTIYECGEPTVGSAWIQFDVRYYVVALLFVVFDVEVAFFFPWAIVFGTVNEVARQPNGESAAAIQRLETGLPPLPGEKKLTMTPETAKSWAWVAFGDIAIFFGVLLMGFAYLWRRGDLDWVRTTISERSAEPGLGLPSPETEAVLVASGHN